MKTQAEQFRIDYSEIVVVNNTTNERLTKLPDAYPHPNSSDWCFGWVFNDNSELWEVDDFGVQKIYTYRNK